MPALVTGAAGHIGANIVQQLLERGEKVRAMVRASSNTTQLPDHPGLEIVHGDVFDKPSLVRAVEGTQFVYHAAAVYSISRKSPQVILDTAIQGTRNILEAVKVAGGVKRIVYTSSVAAVGMTPDPTRILNEDSWTSDPDMDYYTRAKLESERLAHKLASELDLDLVAVNPALVLGPLDLKPTPSNKLVLDFLEGKVPAYLETGLSAVHVGDVAAGHLLAMQKGRKGERYILSGANVKLGEFFEVLGRISGKKPPGIRLPRSLAMGMAFLFETTASLTGGEPLTTTQAMRGLIQRYGFYSFQKAERELGYHPRPLEETLENTVAWFGRNKTG